MSLSIDLPGHYFSENVTPQRHILIKTDIALRLLFNPLSTILQQMLVTQYIFQSNIKLS